MSNRAPTPCVLYKDRVFAGNLTTLIDEEDILTFLWEHGFVPKDAKIIRDRRGVSKGYGFVDMRSDKEGENQTQELLKRRTMYYGDQTIIFKPAYRKSPSSQQSQELVFTKVISSSELFDPEAETDGSEGTPPPTPPPNKCPCCAWPCDSFAGLSLASTPSQYQQNQAPSFQFSPHYFPLVTYQPSSTPPYWNAPN
ncbi:protein boule-like [Bolinopsis microptera]|uniref:protein boule-like n=1 Tax=Bolinopsis microptera TaxID=2820187 RepID=UPI0030797DED